MYKTKQLIVFLFLFFIYKFFSDFLQGQFLLYYTGLYHI